MALLSLVPRLSPHDNNKQLLFIVVVRGESLGMRLGIVTAGYQHTGELSCQGSPQNGGCNEK